MSARLEAWRNHSSRSKILAKELPDGTIMTPWSTIQNQAFPLYDFGAEETDPAEIDDEQIRSFFMLPLKEELEDVTLAQAAR